MSDPADSMPAPGTLLRYVRASASDAESCVLLVIGPSEVLDDGSCCLMLSSDEPDEDPGSLDDWQTLNDRRMWRSSDEITFTL